MSPPATVLAYHAIGECSRADDENSLFVTVEAFTAQMSYLAEHRRVVPLAEAIELRSSSSERRRSRRRERLVAITFDDGYRSVLERAVPVLEAHGFPATMFVPTRYIGDENRWNPPCPCGLDIMSAGQQRGGVQLRLRVLEGVEAVVGGRPGAPNRYPRRDEPRHEHDADGAQAPSRHRTEARAARACRHGASLRRGGAASRTHRTSPSS